jgi:hypothetical protein
MGEEIHGLSFPMRYFAAYCRVKTVTGKKNIVNNLRFFGLLNPEEENLSFLKL